MRPEQKETDAAKALTSADQPYGSESYNCRLSKHSLEWEFGPFNPSTSKTDDQHTGGCHGIIKIRQRIYKRAGLKRLEQWSLMNENELAPVNADDILRVILGFHMIEGSLDLDASGFYNLLCC